MPKAGSAFISSVAVRAQEDRWINVPAHRSPKPALELRPGIDDETVNVKQLELLAPDVAIADLRHALDLIEEEHRR